MDGVPLSVNDDEALQKLERDVGDSLYLIEKFVGNTAA
jgi:hypothetical protein